MGNNPKPWEQIEAKVLEGLHPFSHNSLYSLILFLYTALNVLIFFTSFTFQIFSVSTNRSSVLLLLQYIFPLIYFSLVSHAVK